MIIASGRSSLVTVGLLDQVNEKIRGNRRFTMSELSTHFPHISHSLLHKIIMEHLHCLSLCARWVPKMLTDDHKTKRMGAAPKFSVQYHNEGDEFLNHIVTGDETWISHVTFKRISSSQCSDGIVHVQRQRNSSRHFLPGRSCVPCFGTCYVLLIDIMTEEATKM
jgi:hypothetical protein